MSLRGIPTTGRWAAERLLPLLLVFACLAVFAGDAAAPAAAEGSAVTFSGTLRDRDGGALAGQNVRLSTLIGFAGASATTGIDGSFSLSVAPGSYRLEVGCCPPLGAPGASGARVPSLPASYNVSGPTIELSGDRVQDLTLQNVLLSVTVLGPQGQPLPGAQVGASGSPRFDLFAGGTASGWMSSFGETDATGLVRLPLLQVLPAEPSLPGMPGMPGLGAVTVFVTPPPGSGMSPFSVNVDGLEGDTAITAPRRVTPPDSTPPAITPRISGTLGANGWYTSDVEVDWDVTDPESGVASSSGCETTTISTDTAGTTLTCSARNGADLTREQSVTITRDATAPSITPHISGAEGLNGWYTSDVAVSWTVADAGSGIAASTGCSAATIGDDTAGRTLTCAATDAAGLRTERSVEIRRDATPPEIAAAVAPVSPDGAAGWYVSQPTVTFTCFDATSVIAVCTADGEPGATKAVGESASSQSVTGTATDDAGNVARTSVSGLRVDLSDPVITCQQRPTFLLRQSGAQISATVADAISGAAEATLTRNADTSAVGAGTASFSGRDNAGRTNTVECAYNVVYDWSGFFAPVSNQPAVNQIRAGAAVPLKFSLRGDQGLMVIATGYPQSQQVACDSAAPAGEVVEAATPGASGLVYDAASDTDTFVWITDRAWAGTCRELTLKLADATYHRVSFRFA